MTVEEVKRDLPDVQVRWQGQTYVAFVRGRKEPFATVTPYREIGYGVGPWNGKTLQSMPSWQFSWDAVTRAVRDKTELLAD